ncbi:MAG TPA: hypothetical protein VHY08_23340 [Bacillota bacterium]|nr:hypothetical protein [Bacillota bacterium]
MKAQATGAIVLTCAPRHNWRTCTVNSGGQAIIDERTAAYEKYYGKK